MDPVEPGLACGSDTAHLSLFGCVHWAWLLVPSLPMFAFELWCSRLAHMLLNRTLICCMLQVLSSSSFCFCR